MRRWDARQIAAAAGARMLSGSPATGPQRVTIDSRDAGPGALFVGLPGAHVDGGEFATQALNAGVWGVLISDRYAPGPAGPGAEQAVLVAADPLVALQQLAGAWRRHLGQLGTQVIGVTGSTGKTSTKDLLQAMLSPQRRTVASQANFNTEIGLPLQILAADEDTEVLVLEMGMRGTGQIAELARIAEPGVGVIVSVGPVHLELLGSIEAIAAAKAELIAALPAGGTAVVPAREPLLAPHMRDELRTLRFGEGGNVYFTDERDDHVEMDVDGRPVSFELDFTQRHLRHDLLAATAAACAVGVTPGGRLRFSAGAGRGEHVVLPGDVTLIDGSYNANPMSMRAALEDLATTASRLDARPRRVAVLGDMLELGPDAASFHRQLGGLANDTVDLLVTVGPLADGIGQSFSGEHVHVADAAAAIELLPGLLRHGDLLMVKGSYGVGLRALAESLRAGVHA